MYAITMGGQAIGKAEVQRMGLYYHFDCRCNLSGDVLCRIQAICGENTVNLGILVPEKGEFTLRTKIPVKHLGEGELRFRVIPKEEKGEFIPLSPEEPFRYLRRLQDAFLEVREGLVGVNLEQRVPDQRQL